MKKCPYCQRPHIRIELAKRRQVLNGISVCIVGTSTCLKPSPKFIRRVLARALESLLIEDEFSEFGTHVLEVMCRLREDEVVTISRAKSSFCQARLLPSNLVTQKNLMGMPLYIARLYEVHDINQS